MSTAFGARMRFAQADALVREALGVRFTAAELRVERGGRTVFERAYGCTDASGAVPVEVTTRFDLASLTKPFIAYAALREVAAERLSLDGSLLNVLPEWRDNDHAPITLRMLLAHVSGMQSGADYRTLLNDEVEHYALSRPLVAAPRERVIYSDLGFITLGVILERITGLSLAALLTTIGEELGTENLGFRPRAADIANIPATEEDVWRGRVRGFVHDEKAYLLGGISGHAGLFGSAYDVARLLEAFLACVCGRRDIALPRELVRESLTAQAEDEQWARGLGWMLKRRDDIFSGTRLHLGAFGHTGFTGGCAWADPQRDVQIVLLTNAVYFERGNLRHLRACVCDAVIEELDACSP